VGKLWKTRFKWTGHWRAPGQNVAFSSKRGDVAGGRQLKNEAYISDLGLPEAFNSLFWIEQESRFPKQITSIRMNLFGFEKTAITFRQIISIQAFEIDLI